MSVGLGKSTLSSISPKPGISAALLLPSCTLPCTRDEKTRASRFHTSTYGLSQTVPSISNCGTQFKDIEPKRSVGQEGATSCRHWWKYARYRRWEGITTSSSLISSFWQTSCNASTGCTYSPRNAIKQLKKTAEREKP